jgi:hypothetical protein
MYSKRLMIKYIFLILPAYFELMDHYKSTIYLVIISALLIFVSCNTNSNERLPSDLVKNPNSATGMQDVNLPVIEFEKEIHDFGKVIQGEKVSFGFKFKNTGNADLVIANVSTTCGCTVPKYPKTVIKSGDENVITVFFDSEGKKGVQNKSITISTNCQPSNAVIRIKAMVVVL